MITTEVNDQPFVEVNAPIVVAVDSSASSRHALEQVIRLANYTGAAVYAVDYIYDEEMETFDEWLPDQRNELIADRRNRLERWLQELDFPTDRVEIRVSVGHPLSELLTLMEEVKPRMLVVGMHGNHNISEPRPIRYFTKACLRYGPSEVLLVRDYQSGPLRSIVAAIDFSETSRHVLRAAAAFAQAEKCELKVVHIFSPNWEYFGSRENFSDQIDAYLANLKSRFEDLIEDNLLDFPGVNISYEIREEISPADGIFTYASEVEADLIVVGWFGRAPADLELPGSTAEEILRLSDCSVLAVRP